MNSDRDERFARAAELLCEAQALLDGVATHRLRVLLQMALLEADKERDALKPSDESAPNDT